MSSTQNNVLNNIRIQVLENRPINNNEWNLFQQTLFENGIGMEETLQYLYFNRPEEAAFFEWLNNRKQNLTNENNSLEIPDVLDEEDLDFWNKNGYVVIKNAIPLQDCEETQRAILSFIDASLDNPNSWYENHTAKEGLMVLFTKHPTLEKNRASLKIRKAYEQLYGTKAIYKTIDKVSFNPPENNFYSFKGSSLHWDVSLQTPIPFSLQGLLYLTDVHKDSGAFHCVPGFHHSIEDWLQSVPEGINPRDFAIKDLIAIPILGNAGDFIIWHQALPHCASSNKSLLPRIVQYLTYLPIEKDSSEEKEWK